MREDACGASHPRCSSWIWCHDSLSLILLWNTQGFLMKCVCLSVYVCVRKEEHVTMHVWHQFCAGLKLTFEHNDFLITPARDCRGTAFPVGRSDRNNSITSCAVSLNISQLISRNCWPNLTELHSQFPLPCYPLGTIDQQEFPFIHWSLKHFNRD